MKMVLTASLQPVRRALLEELADTRTEFASTAGADKADAPWHLAPPSLFVLTVSVAKAASELVISSDEVTLVTFTNNATARRHPNKGK